MQRYEGSQVMVVLGAFAFERTKNSHHL